MPEKASAKKKKGETNKELKEALERARNGDRSALPAVRKYLDDKGEEYVEVADLARVTQGALIKRVAGDDLVAQEFVNRRLEKLREELGGPNSTPLERLLVDRVVLCWLQLYETEGRYAGAQDLSYARMDYYQKRIDQLQRRYVAAIKALAQVRRLLRLPSAAVQVNIAEQQVNISERLTP